VTRGLRVGTLLSIALTATWAITVALFLAGPAWQASEPIGFMTMALVSALVVFCTYLANRRGSPFEAAMDARLALFIWMFYLVPFLGYLALPTEVPFLGYPRRVTGALLNETLLYTLLGLFFFPLGYRAGIGRKMPALPGEGASETPWVSLRVSRLLALFVVYGAFVGYLRTRAPSHFVGVAAGEGTAWMRLFSMNPLILIGTVYLFESIGKISRRHSLFLASLIVLWQFFQVLLGSRSSIVFYALLIFSYILLRRRDKAIPARVVGLVGVLGIAGLMTFPIGYAMREFRAEIFLGHTNLSLTAILAVIRTAYQEALREVLVDILKRLSYLDHLMMIVNGPLIDPKPFTGLMYDLRSFVNLMVPGDVFPKALDGSSTFPLIYMEVPYTYFVEYQKLTMPWQLWGIVFSRVGWWLSPPVFWAIGFLSARSLRTLLRRVPLAWRVYVGLWAFQMVFGIVDNFGIDAYFAGLVYDALPYVVALPLLRFFVGMRSRGPSPPISTRVTVGFPTNAVDGD